MNQKLFNECFDNTKDEYYQILKIIEENKNYPKIQCEGRELHHIIPCNYWMSILKISRYKAQKIEECKDEDNLISLSYIDHVKIHYFYYKCCKEIINKACIHSFNFMLKTRDIHLKEITESWINEHKQEIEELKEKMSELHSEVAKESNKGRYKYETQEDVLNAWKNGELSRSRYTDYCRSRGWKIEKLSASNKMTKEKYKMKFGFENYDELMNMYKNNKISKLLFIKICNLNKWDYKKDINVRQMRNFKNISYDDLLNLYNCRKISRSDFLNICRYKHWKYERIRNRYFSYDDLKNKYINGDINYNNYQYACRIHGWENEFKKNE